MSVLDSPRARVLETSISFPHTLHNFTWWTKRGLDNFHQHGNQRKKMASRTVSILARAHKSDHKAVYSCKQRQCCWSSNDWGVIERKGLQSELKPFIGRTHTARSKQTRFQALARKHCAGCIDCMWCERWGTMRELMTSSWVSTGTVQTLTAVKEMSWATSLGWILDQWKSNVRFSSFLLWAASTSTSPVCRRAKESPFARYLSARIPLVGWKSLLAICGQNRQASHCLNHGMVLNHNREPSLIEWAKFITLETVLNCNLILCETTGIISCKKSASEEKWQKVGIAYNFGKTDLISPILTNLVEVWELCQHLHLKKRNSSTS